MYNIKSKLGHLYLLLGVLLSGLFSTMALAKRATLESLPKDTVFSGEKKFTETVNLFAWLFKIIPVFPGILMMVYAGLKLRDQEYGKALGALLGAIICALAAWLVGVLL